MTKRAEHASDEPHANGVRATVVGSLANGMFRLQLTDGREVVAHAAMDLRKVFTRLLPGDSVSVEVSPFDPNRGRICSLLKSPHQTKQHRQNGRSRPSPNQPQQREQS